MHIKQNTVNIVHSVLNGIINFVNRMDLSTTSKLSTISLTPGPPRETPNRLPPER